MNMKLLLFFGQTISILQLEIAIDEVAGRSKYLQRKLNGGNLENNNNGICPVKIIEVRLGY